MTTINIPPSVVTRRQHVEGDPEQQLSLIESGAFTLLPRWKDLLNSRSSQTQISEHRQVDLPSTTQTGAGTSMHPVPSNGPGQRRRVTIKDDVAPSDPGTSLGLELGYNPFITMLRRALRNPDTRILCAESSYRECWTH